MMTQDDITKTHLIFHHPMENDNDYIKRQHRGKYDTENRRMIIEIIPKLIWRAQSLWRYRSTSSATSSSVSGSPRIRLRSSAASTGSTALWGGAAVPVHLRASRPGPKGENLGDSRKPMGSTEGLVSEYEYLKSKGRSELRGWVGALIGLGSAGFFFFFLLVFFWLLGCRVLEIGEKGGSSSSAAAARWWRREWVKRREMLRDGWVLGRHGRSFSIGKEPSELGSR